jgi:hypothetical protein
MYRLKNDASSQMDMFVDEMKIKLDALGSPSHFYMDTNLILLFYDILPWRTRNPNNFDVAIDAVNNVLILETETQKLSEFCVEHYEVAMDQRKLALNNIYGIIYELEHFRLVRNKLRAVLQRLMVLLERHMDTIRERCATIEQQREPTVLTRYIEDAKGVKANDPMINFAEPF